MKDPYEILQVSKNAEIEVIEAAYRRLARKYHPDTNAAPDANERMRDINWAYKLLQDPLERASYDRTHSRYQTSQTYAPPRSQAQSMLASTPPTGPPVSPSPAPPRPALTTATRREVPQKSFLQKYWLLLALGAAAYIYFTNFNSSGLSQSSSPSTGSSSSSINQDPYADCIPWTMTYLYDGQRKCVIGKMIVVSYTFDTLSGSDVWTVYFSMNPGTGFRVISVDRDISKWESQCVVVYGTLFGRDLILKYADNPAPSMVDSDPYDDRGFSISSAPAEKCN